MTNNGGTTMADETYNGWSNRETWAANLWLSNDEGLYNDTLELLGRARVEAEDSERTLEGLVADAIQEFLEALFDPEENEQTSELANVRNDIGSMWRVDWYEIAAAWISDNPADA